MYFRRIPSSVGLRAAASLLALLTFASPPATRAQSELEGLVVREISYEGLERIPGESLEFYLGVKVGDELDLDALNEGIRNLWSFRLIDDISVEGSAVDDGVNLLVRIVERPVLRSIEYDGLKRIAKSDITDRMARDRIDVREGLEVDRGELERLRAAIEEMYREKGFRFAQANYRFERYSTVERSVLFTIDEGDKVRIEDIDFEGNTVYSDRRLRWSMKNTKESGPISRILKHDVYSAATFEEDLKAVSEIYRKAGYKNVTLGTPKIEVKPLRPDAPSADDQKRRLFVTVPIEEGARWKLGEVRIEGNDKFSDELLTRVFRRPANGWLRQKVIDEGLKAIGDAYNNSGYIFARVEHEYVEQPERIADLVVHVDEGDQYKLGRLEFEGNTRTRDKVLRREIRVREGRVFNSTALQNSLRRVQQLQYFALDENNPVEFENFDTENKTVDVTIKGEEGDRTELQFGAGWSELDQFFGQFSFRTRNFRGRGETLGVNIQSGRLRDLYDVSYFIPWFMDRPQTLGVQAFLRETDFTLLTGQQNFQKSAGGTLSYGRNFKFFQSASLTFSRFDVEDRSTLVNQFGELVSRNFDRSVATLRPAYVFDSRDHPLAPTIGRRIALSVEYAGGFLGGTTDFVRPEIDFSLFKAITKTPLHTVFGVNLEAGIVNALGDNTLFPLDRYFIGGEQSVRGFRVRSIWARDEEGNSLFDETGFILGGEKFLQANFELHFVTRGPVRFLLFTDFGNVYAGGQSVDLGRMRQSAGAELRVTVPIFGAPLRFIWAQNIDPLPDDRFETFQFSIGTTF